MNAVFAAAWQRRQNQGTVWMLAGMGLLLVAVPLVLAFVAGPRAAAASGMTVLGIVLAGGWASLVFSAMQQNHPGLARLVPGHVASLRRALALSWFAAVLVFGVAVQAIGGRNGFEAGLAFGLGAMALALMLRWPLSWAFVWLVPTTMDWWLHLPPVRAAWALVQQVDAQQPLLLMAGVAALAALGLLGLIEQGGPAHERAWRRRQRWAASLGAPAPGNPRQHQLGVPGWLMNAATAPYRAWMRHLCRRPRSSAMTRAMLVLGPSAHWTGHLGAALAVAFTNALVIVTLSMAMPGWYVHAPTAAAWGLSFGLMSFALNPLLNSSQAFHATRQEQALLRLAPGVPQGAALNRAIALQQGVHAVIAWIVCAAGAAMLSQWIVDDARTAVAIALSCLPLLPGLWRDWARAAAPSPARMVTVMLQLGACTGVASVLLARGVPLLAIGSLAAVVTLGLAIWRWRALSRAPGAWPAERLAAGA